MVDMELFAIQTFIKQLNKKWPERNKGFDKIENFCFCFHKNLDGSNSSSEDLINEIIFLVKNGKDLERISAVVYKNKIASGEKKNKFWKWENFNQENDDLIEVFFNETNISNKKKFDMLILEIPKRKRGNAPFPGIKVLQFQKRNRSIQKMQKKLISEGFGISEREIGYYGQETCAAVKRYYREVLGIYSGDAAKDGKRFGPKAWERLFS
jgi:hypothetical protein